MKREDKEPNTVCAAMAVALTIMFAIFCVSAWFVGNT